MQEQINKVNEDMRALEKKHNENIQKNKDEFEIKELIYRNKMQTSVNSYTEQVAEVKKRYQGDIESGAQKLLLERKRYLLALEVTYEMVVTAQNDLSDGINKWNKEKNESVLQVKLDMEE